MRWFVLTVVLLAGCAVTPETPEQRLAYMEGQVAAVAEQAVEMRRNGNLSDEDYTEVLKRLTLANRVLDTAWYAAQNDESVSEHLQAIEKILNVVREEVE